ncbi:EAL domain-containing protein [Gallaecimonas sp. GXIMD4217]|uniref:bifunctional diguanylate cyclase/phosphodiesterase n=1 Tax=Gallaecimonas sp. GXIMD4217 TaxID=3131927 RepID=UPI00311B0DBB
MPLQQSHHGILVAISVLIATLAAYTSLVLVNRAHQTPDGRDQWLLFAAAIFGTGVWSMHFTAMLALRLKIPFAFEPLITAASWIMACSFSALALSLKEWLNTPLRLPLAGTLMGMGIAGMHYTGMAAMVVQAEIRYAGWSVLAACLVGIVASLLALRATEMAPIGSRRIRLLAALLGGLAVSGLHFVAMAGTGFHFDEALPASGGRLSLPLLATLVILATLLLMATAWVLSTLAERAQQHRHLYASLSEIELHRRLLRRQVEGLEIWLNDDGRLEHVSGDSQAILGERRLDEHDPWRFLDPPSRLLLQQIWQQLRQQHQLTLCLILTKAGGDTLKLGLDASLSPATGSGLLLLRRIQDRETHLRDSETGLSSRQYLEDQQACPAALTLVVIQVPLFNSLVHLGSTDSYHQALSLWVSRLRQTFQGSRPAYLARLDTDAFLVAIEDEDRQWQPSDGWAVRALLAAPLTVGPESWHLNLAMGITWVAKGSSGKLMVQSALAALRGAQQQLDRMLFVDKADTPVLAERLQLEQELHLAQVASDFRLLFQPKMHLDSGQVTSLEVLLRWHHKDRGMVAPNEFIPLLEHTGLIHHVGDWVLDRALAQLGQWRQHPRLQRLDLAVNISALQLQNDSFVSNLEKSRHHHGVEAHKLILEVTETVAMAQPQVAQHQMDKLRRLGYQLSIDDFGTGYSSLAYLRDFPLHELKIDRTFVQQLDTEEGRQLVKIMGMIGQTLGYRTVAEGVESQAQLTLLRTLGIDLAQGYLIARPMAIQELTDWLLSRAGNSG